MDQDTRTTLFLTNTRHDLGSKTFWFLFSQKVSAACGFLIVALILSVIQNQAFVPREVVFFVHIASRAFFAIGILSLIVSFFASRIVHRNTGFIITEDALKLCRGVFRKEEFAIPYRQIQNIEIERTLSQQMLGTSRFIILTAGEDTSPEDAKDEPEGILPCIDYSIAVLLQEELLRRSNVQKVINQKK